VFGHNEKATIFKSPHPAFEVHSIFSTIQGEGPFTGMPAMFIRLAGCNLKCHFCDTDFSLVETLTVDQIMRRVDALRKPTPGVALAVLTGGEPLRQYVRPLVEALNVAGLAVQVETSGSVWTGDLEPLFGRRGEASKNTIVCSPKTAGIAPGIGPFVHAIKYICESGKNCLKDGLPIRNTQRSLLDAQCRVARPSQFGDPEIKLSEILIQPCDTDDALAKANNLGAAKAVCERFGYRLSVQVHKVINVP
jgi:organic radical activating enzyme